MSGFSRNDQGHALLGGCLLRSLQDTTPTPAYVYDLDGIARGARNVVAALGPGNLVAYALKANSSGTILRTLLSAGCGVDVVSGGELQLALRAGAPGPSILMSGVAKTDSELDLAIGSELQGIHVESLEEIQRVEARARALSTRVRVALRINPSVQIESHAHIATGHDKAKFGIPAEQAPSAWERIDRSEWLEPVGISTHVGSMLQSPRPYLDSARVVCELAGARRAQGKPLEYVDFGGGFGIAQESSTPEPPSAFAAAALELLGQYNLQDHRLMIEPGRSLVGQYGVILARVIQTKITRSGRWLMLDAGMNDLLRPALYHSKHRIESVDSAPEGAPWRVVGPVCESADDFGEHAISSTPTDLVVIRDAGAYGFTMASSYNGRPLPAEVFLANGTVSKVTRSSGVEAWIQARLDA